MDEKRMRELDVSNMFDMLKGFPQQFVRAIEWMPEDFNLPKVSGALVCGMGGSALPADIVNALWIEHLRLDVSREYDLPVWISDDTLVFACSFSGNTEETISAYHKAKERGLPACVITRGGKLQKLAEKNNDPLLLIRENTPMFQPRFGSGYFYAYLLLALQKTGLINADVETHLRTISEKLANYNPVPEAEEIAKRLEGKIPLVYTSGCYTDSVARIWKIKFNENSKIPAFYNAIPELNHNEMVGFTNTLNAPLVVLMLRDKDEHERIKVRFEALKDLLTRFGVDWLEVWFDGETVAERLFKMLYLGDFVTYFLALHYGYNPTPVKIVEDFKKAIS